MKNLEMVSELPKHVSHCFTSVTPPFDRFFSGFKGGVTLGSEFSFTFLLLVGGGSRNKPKKKVSSFPQKKHFFLLFCKLIHEDTLETHTLLFVSQSDIAKDHPHM